MTIRNAQPTDAPLLAELIRNSFRDVAERFSLTAANCPTHPSQCQTSWVESAMAKGVRYYLLEIDGTPAGCVAVEHAKPDVCYIERVAVLPTYRRQGFGRALVQHAIDQVRLLGVHCAQIAIIAEHTELRDWYASLGFIAKDTKSFPQLPFKVTFMTQDV